MRAGWKFTAALGFVGAVAMAAAAFGQVGVEGADPLAQDEQATREGRRARISECRERYRAAETDEERAAIRERCAKQRHPRRDAARRLVHGEMKVQTADGFATIITDAGTVTAVSAGSLTLERADGESVTVSPGENTTIRKDREEARLSDIEAGDHVRVVQVDDGETTTVKLIHAISPQEDAGDDAATTAALFAA